VNSKEAHSTTILYTIAIIEMFKIYIFRNYKMGTNPLNLLNCASFIIIVFLLLFFKRISRIAGNMFQRTYHWQLQSRVSQMITTQIVNCLQKIPLFILGTNEKWFRYYWTICTHPQFSNELHSIKISWCTPVASTLIFL
jgi:hypothetical protein